MILNGFKDKRIITLSLVLSLVSHNIYAVSSAKEISWMVLIFGLLGGLALFLYGMELMSEGMKKTAGNKMRSVLALLTKNRVIAMLCGAFVTMVIQSSSATTVMLVSFVQANLMSFMQSLGVILGADIGTTITAQMIAFKLTDYALLMIMIGFLVRMFAKNESVKYIGEAILGFGVLFFGMKLMSDAMKPLRSYGEFITTLKGLENPLLGIFFGAVFTALIQSSSAFTGIIIVLAQQNLITLEAGIPLVFGANVGTCVTAGLASIGASREAKRVALAHVIFKLAGVLLFIFWIPVFANFIRYSSEIYGFGPARQIANAHTIFNVSLALIFLPFIGLFAKLILKILPEERIDPHLMLSTYHLDYKMISSPAMAIDLVRAEISRMARILGRMLEAVIIPFFKKDPGVDKYFPSLSIKEGLDIREEKLDYLEEQIDDYLVKLSHESLSEDQATEVFCLMSIAKDMESIGDLIHRNMIPLIAKKNDKSSEFSNEGKEELMIYHGKVMKQLKLLQEAFSELNVDKAKNIMSKERKYLDLELQYRARHLQRLIEASRETVDTHEIHMELMDLMKQVIVYSSNIAKTFSSSHRRLG
jgi:phosphate:Na+ symporter